MIQPIRNDQSPITKPKKESQREREYVVVLSELSDQTRKLAWLFRVSPRSCRGSSRTGGNEISEYEEEHGAARAEDSKQNPYPRMRATRRAVADRGTISQVK